MSHLPSAWTSAWTSVIYCIATWSIYLLISFTCVICQSQVFIHSEQVKMAGSINSGLLEVLGIDVIIERHDTLSTYVKKCFVEMVITEFPRYVKKQCWGCQQEGED